MAKTDTPQSDGPDVVDRRKLLTAAAAMTAANTIRAVAAQTMGVRTPGGKAGVERNLPRQPPPPLEASPI